MEDNRKRTKLCKSLQLCISRKLKKIPPIHIPSSAIPASIASRRLLSTCRFPRTQSVDIDQAAAADDDNSRGNGHATTLSDVDRFLFDNFRSLYIHDRDENVRLSSSPGTSTSLVQPTAETSSSSDSVAQDIAGAGDDSGNNTAIVLFSMDPYADFRRSMQDMIRMHHGQESQLLDWDFLEELLFYYLQLNDRSVHKYILKAFAELTAGTHKAPGKPHWAFFYQAIRPVNKTIRAFNLCLGKSCFPWASRTLFPRKRKSFASAMTDTFRSLHLVNNPIR